MTACRLHMRRLLAASSTEIERPEKRHLPAHPDSDGRTQKGSSVIFYEEADRLRQLYLAAVAKGRAERLLDCSF